MVKLFFLLCLTLNLWGAISPDVVDAIVLFDQEKLVVSLTTQQEAQEALPNGKTLVMLASYKGNNEALKYLLSLGGDVNAQDSEGRTALMLAIWNDFKDIIHTLLEHGASVHLKAYDGTTALKLAKLKNDKKLMDDLTSRGAKEE